MLEPSKLFAGEAGDVNPDHADGIVALYRHEDLSRLLDPLSAPKQIEFLAYRCATREGANRRFRRPRSRRADQWHSLLARVAFGAHWHMVDLLWIVLFTLFYLKG